MECVSNVSEYKYLKSRKVGIIGVSVKEGQDLHGPELAPEHIRNAGLYNVITSLDWEYQDYGDIKEIEVDNSKYNLSECKIRNPVEMGAVCHKLHSVASKIADSGSFVLTLGGDHGIATGSISAMKKVS
jgi:arginase